MGIQNRKVVVCDNPTCRVQRIVEEPGDTLGYPEGFYFNRGRFLYDGGVIKLDDLYAHSFECIAPMFDYIRDKGRS